MEDYIIIPKKKEAPDDNKPLIHRTEEKNICCNCGETFKYTLTFGRGVNEINVKLCRSCLESYKKRLDKEFGNTFWGTVDKIIRKPDREIKVTYCD